jgi:hypothetical protein
MNLPPHPVPLPQWGRGWSETGRGNTAHGRLSGAYCRNRIADAREGRVYSLGAHLDIFRCDFYYPHS